MKSGALDAAILERGLAIGQSLQWSLFGLRWRLQGGGDEEDNWVRAGARLMVLFEREPTMKLREGIRDVNIEGRIEFKDVDFSYDPDGTSDNVFANLNLEIPAGYRVGLVGPSGSGMF